jgi:hypothetical protein
MAEGHNTYGKQGFVRVRARMQTALIRGYPKSVDLHTRSHLRTWLAYYG